MKTSTPPAPPRRNLGRLSAAGIAAASALFLVAAPAFAQQNWRGGMVVFGDSLSDTGNTQSLVGRPVHPFYSIGRWTNDATNTALPQLGMRASGFSGVWHEALADRLGLTRATNSRSGDRANNFAYGGATSENGIQRARFNIEVSRNVGQQVKDYTYRFGEATIPADRLYIIWAGGNDVRDEAISRRPTFQSVRAKGTLAADNVGENIRLLSASLGPNDKITIMWPNLPPLDAIPDARRLSPNIRAAMGRASDDFDARQDELIAQYRREFPNVTIKKLDVLGEFRRLIAGQVAEWRPTNVTDNIINAGDFSGILFSPARNRAVRGFINPDQYLFWDQVHPTSRAHALLGELAARVVPTPGSLALLVAGGLLAWPRQRNVP